MPEVERSAKKAGETRGRGGSRASYRLPFGSFEAGAAMEDFPELRGEVYANHSGVTRRDLFREFSHENSG